MPIKFVIVLFEMNKELYKGIVKEIQQSVFVSIRFWFGIGTLLIHYINHHINPICTYPVILVPQNMIHYPHTTIPISPPFSYSLFFLFISFTLPSILPSRCLLCTQAPNHCREPITHQ